MPVQTSNIELIAKQELRSLPIFAAYSPIRKSL
jgi:hypothetical protein